MLLIYTIPFLWIVNCIFIVRLIYPRSAGSRWICACSLFISLRFSRSGAWSRHVIQSRSFDRVCSYFVFVPYFPVRASFINPKVYAVLQIKTNPQSNKKRKLNTGASADRDTDTAWLERIGWREYARVARDFKRGSRRTAKWQQKLILLTTAKKKNEKKSNKSNNTGNKKSNCHYNCEVALAVTSHFAVQQKSCFLCFTVNMHTYVQKCIYIYIKNSYINVSIYS